MKIINTKIKDLLILKSQIFKDKRGALRETYRKDILNYNFPFDIVTSSKKMLFVDFIIKVDFHRQN